MNRNPDDMRDKKNTNYLLIGIVIALVLIGIFFLYPRTNMTTTPAVTNETNNIQGTTPDTTTTGTAPAATDTNTTTTTTAPATDNNAAGR